MTERPIIFSGESVRAILDGSKSQTRRVVLKDPTSYIEINEGNEPSIYQNDPGFAAAAMEYLGCPFGAVGDRLWVRETWGRPTADLNPGHAAAYIGYRADDSLWHCHLDGGCSRCGGGGASVDRWRSPIHMPRWASRITLEITDLRVQRVQEISEEDAIAEGIRRIEKPGISGYEYHGEAWLTFNDGSNAIAHKTAASSYRQQWDTLNAKRGFSWESNPWVWCVTFKVAA